jgi:hypothetical protein
MKKAYIILCLLVIIAVGFCNGAVRAVNIVFKSHSTASHSFEKSIMALSRECHYGLAFKANTYESDAYYKQKIKRKIKVRYRAVYCELQLCIKKTDAEIVCFLNKTNLSHLQLYVHDQFSQTIKLRGPPTDMA